MNELQFSMIDFEIREINILISKLNEFYSSKVNQNFAEVCSVIYELKTYFKTDSIQYRTSGTEQWRSFHDVMLSFGLDKTQVSRMLSCYDKFFESKVIKPLFYAFSKSKLFELLPIPLDVLDYDIKHNFLRPEHTVQTIRKYVRTKLPREIENPETEIDEDTIPMAFNVNNEYPFDYFVGLSQKQLVNCSWELYKELRKYKKK